MEIANSRGRGPLQLIFGLVGLLVASSTVLGQDSAQGARRSDREAILTIMRSWEEAWNMHDMHAFAELFHADGVWILWTGQVWTGRATIESGHAAVHKTVFRNSVQRERLEELTFVGPDAAVLRL
jgi:ketosteroid isomerase-like protein